MEELNLLPHAISTLSAWAVPIGVLLTFGSRIRDAINKDNASKDDLLELKESLIEAIKLSEDNNLQYQKEEIDRVSRWINDNDKESKDSIKTINEYLLNNKLNQ